MGSPICGVLVCLFLDFLELDTFKHIKPKNSTYLRYIDDILLLYPHNIKSVKHNKENE